LKRTTSSTPYRWLSDYSEHLNRINRPRWFGWAFYDMLSGALVWTDECKRWRQRTPVEVVWALRSLWAYRTSLMLDEPREELVEYWRFGLQHFPDWVGFRPNRRRPTKRLLRIYRRVDVETRKCVRNLEKALDGSAGV
jgi:hypothetical protein